MAPSSRFDLSLKPTVAYLVLNFCALWKRKTTLPTLAAPATIRDRAATRNQPALCTGRALAEHASWPQ